MRPSKKEEDLNATCGDGIGDGWRYRVVAGKTGLEPGEGPRRNDHDLAHEGRIDPLTCGGARRPPSSRSAPSSSRRASCWRRSASVFSTGRRMTPLPA